MRAMKILVLVLLVAAIAFVAWRHGSSHINTTTTFFIDEETGEESIRSVHDVAPLLGKSGKPTIVQVFKFTCDGGKTVKTAYYSKFTDGMKSQLEAVYQANKTPDFDTTQGMLIRSPEKGSTWVHWGTPEASKVLSALSCPDGGDIETVFP
jgi:hypothetical protein